ncbi:9259_t:CDS:10, partial [Racocetra fulgida]
MEYGSSGDMWCFPILKDAEIEEFFKELSVDFTAQDMKKPTTARIFIAFGFIVEYTTGATAEEWGDTDWSSNLEMRLRKRIPVMVAIGMEEFSFNDVLRPEVSRLRVFLSAAINFIRFREDQLHIFNEYEKHSEELMKHNEELSERYKMLFEQVERSKKKRIEDESEVKEYLQENASLMSSMRELKKKQTGLLNEIATLKSAKAESEEKIEITACNKILDEVINQRNKCEKANKDLRDLQEEIENKRQHSRELQKKEQRQREKHKQRVIETEKKIEALQAEYDQILEERKDFELKAAQQKKIYDETSAKKMRLRIRSQDKVHIINDLTSTSTVFELKSAIHALSGISPHRQERYPPRVCGAKDDETLSSAGIQNGDQIILSENALPETTSRPVDEIVSSSEAEIVSVPVESGSVILREDPETYSDVILGKSRDDYCSWIAQKNSWGGAIELSIFASHYKVGKDSNNKQIKTYIIHQETDKEYEQTVFNTSDESILNAVIKIADKMKQLRKYTYTSDFTIRCGQCQKGLKGEQEAIQHARET